MKPPISSTSTKPPGRSALGYTPVNRLNPRWVPGIGERARPEPAPDFLIQPWMRARHPATGYIQPAVRIRRASWLVWIVGLAIVGLGGYGLGAIEEGHVPDILPAQQSPAERESPTVGLRLLAESLKATEEPDESTELLMATISPQEPSEAALGQAAHDNAAHAAAQAVSTAPVLSALDNRAKLSQAISDKSLPASAKCSAALIAMQLCSLPGSH